MLTQMDVRLRIFSCLWVAMTMIGAGAIDFPMKPLSLQVFKDQVVGRVFVEMWRLELHQSLGAVATDSWFSFVVTPGEPEYLTMDGQTRINGVCAGRGLHYSDAEFTYADDKYAVLSRDTPFAEMTLKSVYVYFSSHPDQYLLYLACLDSAAILPSDYHRRGLPKSCGGASYVGFVAREDPVLSNETYVIPTSRINLKDVGNDLDRQLHLQFDDDASHFLLVYGPCDNTPT